MNREELDLEARKHALVIVTHASAPESNREYIDQAGYQGFLAGAMWMAEQAKELARNYKGEYVIEKLAELSK